jgi:hypothetical protein
MFLGPQKPTMNPSKSGLSSAGKAGAVVVLIIVIVLGTAYLVQSLSNQSGSSSPGDKQITGMVSLFADFPQMQVSLDAYDAPNGMLTNQTLSYTVLGTGTLNSVENTRVEFATAGESHHVVAWYNSTGGINEVDVLGQQNYTGSGAHELPFMVTYTSEFGTLVSVTNNATLLSTLTKSSETTMSIGPTQMNVTTYVLPARTSQYSSMTVKIGTIPGTDVQLAVYVSEKAHDGSTSTIQVTSLTR